MVLYFFLLAGIAPATYTSTTVIRPLMRYRAKGGKPKQRKKTGKKKKSG